MSDDIDFHKLYQEETGCPVFTHKYGYAEVTWQFHEWKIKKLTALAEKHKGQRDLLIDLVKSIASPNCDCYFCAKLNDAINRIQKEADGEKM